jgi:predicted GNAT family acetyltransferase
VSPESLEALAALCPPRDGLAMIEAGPRDAPPGMRVAERGVIWQMVAQGPLVATKAADFEVTPLDEADAEAMLALATLTKPGPFFARTHQLGDFIGVKWGGVLAAMAGERMKMNGFTEVSAVCTHPDHRGRGYAAHLTRMVAERICARGETPFLHVFDHNQGAIRVYEALGFKLRRKVDLTVIAWARH